MPVLISRDELVARLAEVSHATWILQGVRDYRRSFKDPTGKVVHAETASEYADDLAAAEKLLAAVMAGGTLATLSDNKHHVPTDHDRERAALTVRELERLGLVP